MLKRTKIHDSIPEKKSKDKSEKSMKKVGLLMKRYIESPPPPSSPPNAENQTSLHYNRQMRIEANRIYTMSSHDAKNPLALYSLNLKIKTGKRNTTFGKHINLRKWMTTLKLIEGARRR